MSPRVVVLGVSALLIVAGTALWVVDRIAEGKARHDF